MKAQIDKTHAGNEKKMWKFSLSQNQNSSFDNFLSLEGMKKILASSSDTMQHFLLLSLYIIKKPYRNI